jgi:uncharacterized protein YraI
MYPPGLGLRQSALSTGVSNVICRKNILFSLLWEPSMMKLRYNLFARSFLLFFLLVCTIPFLLIHPAKVIASYDRGLTYSSPPTPEEILEKYDKLKSREWKEYVKTIKGTRVHWIGKVIESSGKTIQLDFGQKSFRYFHLQDIKKDQATVGSYIEFEATVDDVWKFLGLSVFLDNTKIIDVRSTITAEPTPTATLKFTSSPTATLTPTPTMTPTLKPFGQISVQQNVNIRSGPSTNFQVTQVFRPGESLFVYGRSEDSQWLWVDPVEQVWVNAMVVTADFNPTTIPLGPTMEPTATITPIPTQTLRPTATPIPAVFINDIYQNYKKMTVLQFTEYKKEIAGKPVRENVKVSNVSDRGNIGISGPWSSSWINFYDFCITVAGMPKEKAINLNGGDRFFLEATVSRIVGDYNYYSNCKNTLVLYYVAVK